MDTTTEPSPRLSESQKVFECPWFHVHAERWEHLPEGDQPPFFRIDSPDGVLVLALTRHGDIILVRQYRHAIRRMTLELPAGSVEKGESHKQAASRELFEETGFRAGSFRLLGGGHLMGNRFNARDSLWLAQDCERTLSEKTGQSPDIRLVSGREFKGLVVSGAFEQFPALALFSLVEWQLGLRIVG